MHIMKLFILITSLVFISTNIESGPFDKLKDIAPVIDLVKKEEEKKKKEEEERKKKEEAEKKKKEEEIKRLEKQKQAEIKEKESLENFYKLFNEKGTELTTETTITLDGFGDELKSESNYFFINNQKYDVVVICTDDLADIFAGGKYNRFPFGIYAEFPEKLDYSIDRQSPLYGTIFLNFKLGSGRKEGTFKAGTAYIMNSSGTSILFSNLNKFYSVAFYDELDPFNLNLSERKNSMSNGEINILIPKKSSGNYSLKFNPFHNSWAELHKRKCGPKTADNKS